MVEHIFAGALISGIFFGILCIGGIISDYILPHIKPLVKWVDSLPMMNDLEDDDILSFTATDASTAVQEMKDMEEDACA